MDESDKVHVDDRAWIGWQKLPAHVKTDILRTLEPLAGLPPERWPARIKRWPSEENLYVLPVWVDADELFVFAYPNGSRHADYVGLVVMGRDADRAIRASGSAGTVARAK